MWCIYLKSRETGESFGIYADGFATYDEARTWASFHEMEARRAGQMLTVGWVEAE